MAALGDPLMWRRRDKTGWRRFRRAPHDCRRAAHPGAPYLVSLRHRNLAQPNLPRLSLVTLTAPAFNLRRQAFAYMAEVVRSGIESVPKGQWEAAASLGLGYVRIMRLVVLPQALRVMIPPTIGVYVSTIKESSLASIVGFVELLGQGMAIRESNAGCSTAGVLMAIASGISRCASHCRDWASISNVGRPPRECRARRSAVAAAGNSQCRYAIEPRLRGL